MKKWSKLLALLLALVVCACVFAACGGKGDPNDPSGNNNGQQPEITADTQFDDIVSDRVTAEEWSAIEQNFANNKNFRVIVTLRGTLIGGETINKRAEDIEISGEYFHIFQYYDVYTQEAYGTWKKTEDNRNPTTFEAVVKIGSQGKWHNSLISSVPLASCSGNQFSFHFEGAYNEQYKGYYFSEGSDGFIFKFKGGKLVAFAAMYNDEEIGKTKQELVFYDYGKVPELQIPEVQE